jgi:hypothetical protein
VLKTKREPRQRTRRGFEDESYFWSSVQILV